MKKPRILIIEDEPKSATRLARMIHELSQDVDILEVLDTVSDSIHWFEHHPDPDLIFSDIHLADGSCFSIFENVQVSSPIIFTTAFDEYALKGFKLNSIDYLLKPIKMIELKQAWDKFQILASLPMPVFIDYESLASQLKAATPVRLKRIVIRFSGKIKAIEMESIAYFFLESRVVMLRTHEGKNYPVDFNLDQLDKQLDSTAFFRINRKCIVSLAAIQEMYVYSKSRVKVILTPPPEFDTITSSDRSGAFKQWLTGEIL